MAIDSQNKRRSTQANLPVPNYTIGIQDRPQVCWIYRGLTINAIGTRFTATVDAQISPTASVLANISPAASVAANISPTGTVRANISPTAEVDANPSPTATVEVA